MDGLSNAAAIPLKGTPLQGLSLDQLLQNVRDNECYRERSQILRLQDLVRRIYLGYLAARGSVVRPGVISKTYQLHLPTVITWRNGCFPMKLTYYARSYLPTTREQRSAFAYVLGVVSNHAPSEETQASLSREHPSPPIRKRLVDAVKTISGYKPPVKGERVVIHNAGLVRLVRGLQRTSLRDYITTVPEARAFLQGFLDHSEIMPQARKDDGVMIYTITSSSEVIYIGLVLALSKLKVYPSLSSDGTKMEIKGLVDLNYLYQSGVISDTTALEIFEEYFADKQVPPDPLPLFYEVHNDAVRRKQDYGSVNIAELARVHPEVKQSCIIKWVAKIRGVDCFHSPHRVSRYEIICDFLGIKRAGIEVSDLNKQQTRGNDHNNSNRYEEIKAGGVTYYLPPLQRSNYLRAYDLPPSGFDDSCREHLADQILFNLRNNSRRDFDIEIGDDGVITRLTLRGD
ncbi:hypothetical protein HYY69_00745 [Candidatus Woesearchaeota archaeon]|nr:hypothetical protein [Candidatus Woesearchaeota archaeon]